MPSDQVGACSIGRRVMPLLCGLLVLLHGSSELCFFMVAWGDVERIGLWMGHLFKIT